MPDSAAADSPNLAQLKRRQNQEQTLAERERQRDSEKNGPAILWEQFLEAVRCQREMVSGLSADNDADLQFAREVQKYVALSLYAAIPPSRSKEIRLLSARILSEAESSQSLQNHVAVVQGRHVLVMR